MKNMNALSVATLDTVVHGQWVILVVSMTFPNRLYSAMTFPNHFPLCLVNQCVSHFRHFWYTWCFMGTQPNVWWLACILSLTLTSGMLI
jgi:hypothetical protein